MNLIKMYPLDNIKNIKYGDQLEEVIVESIEKSGLSIDNGDIVVIAHKIVSKAEGRFISLKTVNPSKEAMKISKITGKDPALVEVILKESREILKVTEKGIIISRHKLGFVCANAGVDNSNSGKLNHVVLLPENPDQSANNIRTNLGKYFNKRIAVVINDSHGRVFREGAIGVAIGSSGIKPLKSYIGKKDRNGYIMKSSVEAIIDEIASAATLIMGQCDEGLPIVLMKGFNYEYFDEGIAGIIREPEKELFH